MTASDYLIGFLWAALAWQFIGFAIRTVCSMRAQADKSRSGLDFTMEDVWFSRLFNYGMDGASITFTPVGIDRTVSLHKHVTEGVGHHVSLHLPVRGFVEDDLVTLRDYCRAHDLSVEKSSEAIGDVLRIDCGDDAVKAYDLTLEIWTRVFRSGTKRSFRRDVAGINVDTPYVGPHSWPFFVVRAGLAIAAIHSIGAAPDWTVPLGRANLSGTVASLAFFIGFFLQLSFSAFRRGSPFLTTSWILKFVRLGHVLIGLTLPIAVLLVWAGAAG